MKRPVSSAWMHKLDACVTRQEIQALVSGREYARDLVPKIPPLTERELEEAREKWRTIDG